MNNFQLLQCVAQDELLVKYCIGVYASDTIPKTIHQRPICYIFNTDPIGRPGTHWQARFFECDGIPEHFDSYGRQPQKGTYNYNSVRIQGPLSTTCGQYCLYYISHRARGRSMNEIVNDFSQDYVLNDLSVNDYVNKYFNLNEKPYDLDHIISQICISEK